MFYSPIQNILIVHCEHLEDNLSESHERTEVRRVVRTGFVRYIELFAGRRKELNEKKCDDVRFQSVID